MLEFLVIFGSGVAVGVIYDKAIRGFKAKAVKAARAASDAMKD